MYCIMTVIYGVPLNQKVYDEVENMGHEPEDLGMETLYSGAGDITPGYCGVELSTFDEATDMSLLVSSIKMVPDQKQINEANKLIAALPSKIQSMLPKPDVFIIFHTS